MLGIVRIVIDGGHGAHLVVSLYEHSLWVHIGEAQWTDDFCHTFLAAPLLGGIKQRAAHLDIIDEIYPTEAKTLTLPLLVGTMIDDGGYASGHLAILVSQEILSLAKLEGSILIFAQGVKIVGEKIGRIVLITLIQIVMKIDKSLKTFLVSDFSNFYC